MKKTLPAAVCFAILCISEICAQTIIPGGNVTGPWTAAGSPYIVTDDITCGNLVIQAGVDVRFQNHSGLQVYGSLKANGTAANPVIFEADDTTGYSNLSISNGGHKGIYVWGNGTDTTILDHIIFRDAKGLITDISAMGIVSITPKFILKDSEVYHNYISGTSYVIYVTGAGTQVINNHIYNNYGRVTGGVSIQASSGLISGNHIHDNSGSEGAALYCVSLDPVGPTISNNNIHNNRSELDAGGIFAANGPVLIENNIIAFNHSARAGSGIYIMYAEAKIYSNLICNNSDSVYNNCGINDGGGGILINNSSGNYTSRIVNNVVANNTSYYSGGGIRVSGSTGSAWIENNHIINNSCVNGLYASGLDFNTYIHATVRNNIIWGNRGFHSAGNPDSVQVYINAYDTISFEFNFIESSVMGTVLTNAGTQINGTATTNIYQFNTNPGIVNVTAGAGAAHDGTAADWHLVWGSICINHGTVSFLSAPPLATDFYGDQRVFGAIDIGAVEYPMENSIEEHSADNVHTFPNPATDKVNVDGCINGTAVTITDVNGNTVLESTCNNGISVNELSSGIYLIKFIDGDGIPRVAKFVKR